MIARTDASQTRYITRTFATQGGVVLVIALILLAVIAASSAVVMQNALSGSVLSNNLKDRGLARQAAQAALRWCEDQALLYYYPDYQKDATLSEFNTTANAFTGLDEPAESDTATGDKVNGGRYLLPAKWKKTSNWDAAGNALTVPATVLPDPNTSQGLKYQKRPLCMVEMFAPKPSDTEGFGSPQPVLTRDHGFIATVRGFSPNYVDGKTGSGAEVWLQSIVLVRSTLRTNE